MVIVYKLFDEKFLRKFRHFQTSLYDLWCGLVLLRSGNVFKRYFLTFYMSDSIEFLEVFMERLCFSFAHEAHTILSNILFVFHQDILSFSMPLCQFLSK